MNDNYLSVLSDAEHSSSELEIRTEGTNADMLASKYNSATRVIEMWQVHNLLMLLDILNSNLSMSAHNYLESKLLAN